MSRYTSGRGRVAGVDLVFSSPLTPIVVLRASRERGISKKEPAGRDAAAYFLPRASNNFS